MYELRHCQCTTMAARLELDVLRWSTHTTMLVRTGQPLDAVALTALFTTGPMQL